MGDGWENDKAGLVCMEEFVFVFWVTDLPSKGKKGNYNWQYIGNSLISFGWQRHCMKCVPPGCYIVTYINGKIIKIRIFAIQHTASSRYLKFVCFETVCGLL